MAKVLLVFRRFALDTTR